MKTPKLEALTQAGTPAAGYLPMSPRMRLKQTWIIELEKYHPRSDEDRWASVDLADLWLPVSAFNSEPVKLISRPELCEAICTVMDQYLIRQSWSKSTHVIAITKVSHLAKFFEYCWLHGIFRLSDWPKEMWTQFLADYRQGGWSTALNLRRRAENAISSTGAESMAEGIRRSGRVPRQFLAQLGTNARGVEIIPIRQAIQKVR